MSVRPINLRRRGPTLDADCSDGDLAAAVADGSEPALAEIYRRYGAAVHGTALAVLKDRSLAEDVTQLVFVTFWERPDRFDPARGSLRSLLVSIAHNRGIDVLRSNASRARREERDAVENRLVAVPDPVAGEAWHELSSAVLSTALASLEADQREAIELAYFGGRTYREVATELSVPEGTVKSRIRRGLERLRVVLDSQGLR